MTAVVERRQEGVSRAALGAVVALAAVSAVVFAGVALHEWGYASDHPFAYGPAKVVALACAASAALAVAVAVLAVAMLRQAR